jgi:hypothetical protein
MHSSFTSRRALAAADFENFLKIAPPNVTQHIQDVVKKRTTELFKKFHSA